MTEKLALEQLRRDRRTVHSDQRVFGTLAGLVDGPGDQLLAGTRLAVDQHTGIGGADNVYLLNDP
ncbi:hypothetical protein D9M69_617180 [compost metagenome]